MNDDNPDSISEDDDIFLYPARSKIQEKFSERLSEKNNSSKKIPSSPGIHGFESDDEMEASPCIVSQLNKPKVDSVASDKNVSESRLPLKGRGAVYSADSILKEMDKEIAKVSNKRKLPKDRGVQRELMKLIKKQNVIGSELQRVSQSVNNYQTQLAQSLSQPTSDKSSLDDDESLESCNGISNNLQSAAPSLSSQTPSEYKAADSETVNEMLNDRSNIRLKIRLPNGESVNVVTKTTSTFQKIYAFLSSKDFANAKLSIDGQVIPSTATPAQFDLCDNDQIDVL